MNDRPPDLRPGRPQRPPGSPQGPGGAPGRSEQGWPRWLGWALVGLLGAVVVLTYLFPGGGSTEIDYSTFTQRVAEGKVAEVEIGNQSGSIKGKYKQPVEEDGHRTTEFSTRGPEIIPDADLQQLREKGVEVTFKNPGSNVLGSLLFYLLPIGALILFWLWMSRRAQGQMSGLMSVGRSRAKVYTTEKPGTAFADVAGYEGVKQEIKEVVDFLKSPAKFREIGARIPKGVLLVGPPGTGKTLLARAVAGEAGVPFMSVTGSDFMEMFVGVGASRVRDMFQTARKQAPCIIFIDELDSIGRKRGAGLGGGHDEREQTLNQILSEMDGFEATEGIVMMAATNRPDILDAALLRPGRFDRQIIVPLPDLNERLPILQVHSKDKKIGPDVDLEIVARGTPGMSGADLANLVNEAALHAVRRGSAVIEMSDFEGARDRVLMGQRREAIVLSDKENISTAIHEGGHAVLAYVLENADPVHKVTILPTGMALGATQQLPAEERHSYWREYINDSLCVMLGGRCAEMLMLDTLSTGSANDLQRATETARRMVREWGMSDRIGPMAWGTQGAVFLGDDIMHTRDYSDETSRVIDEEVERILREQEARAMEVLSEHRDGLQAVADALVEHETIDGGEVGQLVDTAAGRTIRPAGVSTLRLTHPDAKPPTPKRQRSAASSTKPATPRRPPAEPGTAPA